MKHPQLDVAIVGYGPVGQLLCGLLGRRNLRVAAFEQWPAAYALPRACVVDHEIMRILQADGIAERFEKVAVNIQEDYIWTNAAGDSLLRLQRPAEGVCGWGARYMMYQPDLEALLDASARSLNCVEVHRGWRAMGLRQNASGVELDLESGQLTGDGSWIGSGERQTVQARYLVGADGANSFVRGTGGFGWRDLGFRADWLVIDFRPHDPDMQIDMPMTGQICDPQRPVSLFRRLGHKHVRWEMMLRPGETAAAITQPESIWSLLSRWVTPADGTIVRNAVYTFRSAVAEQWRNGRVVLAGDAAHVMPPFLGQGMCSGMRDAMSLAWRLAAIQRGEAADAVLDSYTPERREHVEGVIACSVALGKIVCITDPDAAAERDAQFLSGVAPPLPKFPSLHHGILHYRADGSLSRAAGELCLQARVEVRGSTKRFDDEFGCGWLVLSFGTAEQRELSALHRSFLQAIGARLVHIAEQGASTLEHDAALEHDTAIDIDGRYEQYFRSLEVRSLVVRPDFYIFGSAATSADLSAVIDDLMHRLPLPPHRQTEFPAPQGATSVRQPQTTAH